MADESSELRALRERLDALERRTRTQFMVLMAVGLLGLMSLSALGMSHSLHLQSAAHAPP